MVVARSAHTCKPNQSALPGTKTASAAFLTRRFMHAFYDTPSFLTDTDGNNLIHSAGAESTCAKFPAILDVSASADHHSSQEQQHWQAWGSKLINEITPKYVQQLLAELEQERAAKHRANCRILSLREEVECLKEDNSRLENDLEQSQLKRSVLEADLMLLRKQKMPELLEENEGLKDKCESLTCQLDNAYNEIRALAYPTPTPASSADLESDNGIEDGDPRSIEIAGLRFDCDNSRQRMTVLERQVYMLAKKLEHTHGRLDRVNQDTLRSGVHEATVAPTITKPAYNQICRQSKLGSESTGPAMPTHSGDFKNPFDSGLGSPELLRSKVLAAPPTPQPAPQLVFFRYYTGDTPACLGMETVTVEVAPKAATAAISVAAKAAK
ncbi:hypothetical protein GGI11_007834, partial [Coemansia sp. RSA 2049]